MLDDLEPEGCALVTLLGFVVLALVVVSVFPDRAAVSEPAGPRVSHWVPVAAAAYALVGAGVVAAAAGRKHDRPVLVVVRAALWPLVLVAAAALAVARGVRRR